MKNLQKSEIHFINYITQTQKKKFMNQCNYKVTANLNNHVQT